MFSPKKYILLFFILIVGFIAKAQEGTRTTTDKNTGESGKIMLIPFQPKLYMSEMDMKINQQTKWDFETIRENFRHQLDSQLKSKLQENGSIISFYNDSAKMWKDMDYIYKSINLSYDLVDKPSAATAPIEKKTGIKNGQIAVEINEDKKFMNTRISNNEVLSYLNKKYSSDYFIFINELDIKSDLNSYDMASDTYQREVSVHYSILDKNGKTINAGISISRFSSKENNPKKIISQCFSPIAADIASKLPMKPTMAPKK